MCASHRPEIDVLAACASPKGPDDLGAIEKHLRYGFDWDKLRALARYHGVLQLVFRSVSESAASLVPSDVLADLETESRANAARSMYLTSELIALCGAFAAARIPVLPFKGPLLAVSAYGSVALRRFDDLDLLIRPEDVGRAARLLEARGYGVDPRLQWLAPQILARWNPEMVYDDIDRGISVDLHWRLLLHHYPVQLDAEVLWQSITSIQVGGSCLPSLTPEISLLVLAMHGSKHCWQRLGWIADIAWLLHRNPRMDVESLVRQAQAWNCVCPLLLALAAAQDILLVELSTRVTELIEEDSRVRLLRQQVGTRLTDGPLTMPDSRELFSFAAAMAGHKLASLRHLFWLLVAPTEAEWRAFALPAQLFFLYVPYRASRLFRKYVPKISR